MASRTRRPSPFPGHNRIRRSVSAPQSLLRCPNPRRCSSLNESEPHGCETVWQDGHRLAVGTTHHRIIDTCDVKNPRSVASGLVALGYRHMAAHLGEYQMANINVSNQEFNSSADRLMAGRDGVPGRNRRHRRHSRSFSCRTRHSSGCPIEPRAIRRRGQGTHPPGPGMGG